MKQNEDRRIRKDRRQSSNKRSEKFIKYFIPEEKEKRNGEDRRQPNPDRE